MSSAEPSARRIALIVAAARNRVIGHAGTMPWHMPGDLKTFRKLTMGQPIIMGRKTHQAIGRALDGRTNIVITRDTAFKADGVEVAHTFAEALALANNAPSDDNYVMVIGGGEIYRAALPHADTVYLTEIAAEPAGDTWFPELDPAEWVERERQAIVADPRDDHAAVLIVYDRAVGAR